MRVLFLTVVAWRGKRREWNQTNGIFIFQQDMNEITNLLCDQKGNISEWAFGNDGIQFTACEAWADRRPAEPSGGLGPLPSALTLRGGGRSGTNSGSRWHSFPGAGDRAPHNTCNRQGVLAGAHGAHCAPSNSRLQSYHCVTFFWNSAHMKRMCRNG